MTKNCTIQMLRIGCVCLLGWQNMVWAIDENEINADNLDDLSLASLLEIEIVSIATGKKQSVVFAPANTTTFTAEDITRLASLDIDELLQSVPGLHVACNPLSYYNPIYTLGGIASAYNP